jgi:hypothetical protein
MKSRELIPSQISDNAADIEHAIESFAQMPDGGLLFVPDATIIAHRDLVITLAARHRMRAIGPQRRQHLAGVRSSSGSLAMSAAMPALLVRPQY